MRRIGLGVVALLLLLAGVRVLVAQPWDDGGTKRAEGDRRADGSTQSDRHRKVYTIHDARDMVEGEDYEVLHEVPGSIAYKAEVVLPDGDLVLVHRYRFSRDTGQDLPDLIQVWDPRTGERETVPTSWPAGIANVTATSATDLWATFGIRRTGYARERLLLHYDRTTGQTRRFTMPDPPRARSRRHPDLPQIGGDGRIYFLTGRELCYRTKCVTPDDRELWSFAPDDPDQVRREAENVGFFGVSRRLLVWSEQVEGHEDDVVDLHIRRAGSSRVTTVGVPACFSYGSVGPIRAVDDRVLLDCGRVYDDRGRLLARLRIHSHDLRGMTAAWIARGWTLWHPRTGRLLRTADDRIIWHDRPVAMSGDLLLFPRSDGPRNTRNGTWLLARLVRPGQSSAG